jgi:hypothetical protein
MTAAPGIDDPDLSLTFPEKLPVAWPRKAGEASSAITQIITRSSILLDFVSADLEHIVPSIVRSIVKPLLTNRLRWLLHRLGCPGCLDCKNCAVESQRKFWPAYGYHGISGKSWADAPSAPDCGTQWAAHGYEQIKICGKGVFLQQGEGARNKLKLQLMTLRRSSKFRILCFIIGLLTFAASPNCAKADPTPEAVSAFNAYVKTVESRLAQQHQSRNGFLAPPLTPQNEKLLQQGELIIEPVTPITGSALPGALLHDWRGTAFAPGATVADFERLMKNISAYPQHFSPQVLQAKVLTQQGDHLQAFMRVRQKHVITVVMDTTYDITFGRLDDQHGYSLSRSTRVSEIGSPGTAEEHTLPADEEHGFLWRQNTYWTYEEGDGGLYMQIESVSLSRSVPNGLNWIVQPFIEKIPRESLEFTLRSTCDALRK